MAARRARLNSPMVLVALERGRPELSLPLGYVTLGYSSSCDLVVKGKGVRHRHATLRVEPQLAAVERGEPSAELRVNEVLVQRAAVTPGDVLAVGSVRMRLEARSPDPRPAALEELLEEPSLELQQEDVGLLEELFEWSRAHPLERRGAMLGLLVERLRGRGAVLVLGGAGPSLSVVTSWGEVAEILQTPWIGELLQRVARGEDTGIEARDGWELSATPIPGGRSLGLAVGGREQRWNPHLLRLCLRFLAHEYLRADLKERLPRATLLPLAFPPGAVVGRAPAMRRVYEQVSSLADHEAPVLIQGETGTGKEAIARLIHQSSPRRDLPFVVIDGSSGDEPFRLELTRHLLAAPVSRKGERPTGTVLVDELGRLSAAQQSQLVSVVDRLARAGTGTAFGGGPRLLVSTQLEVEPALARGEIRADLYFRVAAFVITVPTLRDRREDIPLLFDHYLLAELGATRPPLAPDALAALMRYPWPGNLRELRQEAARVAARGGDLVTVANLSPAIAGHDVTERRTQSGPMLDLRWNVERLEGELVPMALARAGGNLSRAARLLGVSRPWLRRRLRATTAR